MSTTTLARNSAVPAISNESDTVLRDTAFTGSETGRASENLSAGIQVEDIDIRSPMGLEQRARIFEQLQKNHLVRSGDAPEWVMPELSSLQAASNMVREAERCSFGNGSMTLAERTRLYEELRSSSIPFPEDEATGKMFKQFSFGNKLIESMGREAFNRADLNSRIITGFQDMTAILKIAANFEGGGSLNRTVPKSGSDNLQKEVIELKKLKQALVQLLKDHNPALDADILHEQIRDILIENGSVDPAGKLLVENLVRLANPSEHMAAYQITAVEGVERVLANSWKAVVQARSDSWHRHNLLSGYLAETEVALSMMRNGYVVRAMSVEQFEGVPITSVPWHGHGKKETRREIDIVATKELHDRESGETVKKLFFCEVKAHDYTFVAKNKGNHQQVVEHEKLAREFGAEAIVVLRDISQVRNHLEGLCDVLKRCAREAGSHPAVCDLQMFPYFTRDQFVDS